MLSRPVALVPVSSRKMHKYNMIKKVGWMTGCSVFMQDGAPCHTAKSIKAWLSDSGVPVLDWVGQSCDCNPIENLWRGLKKEVYKLGAASNLAELEEKIRIAWKKLGKDTTFLAALTNSMPNRIEAVIAAKGDVTKY